jgi:hypothetical protein
MTNETESIVRVSLNGEIYDRWSVSLAIDECDPAFLSVIVAEQNESVTLLRFADPSGTAPDDHAVREFLNRVLELSVRAALQDSGI